MLRAFTRARATGRLYKGPLCDCDAARLILLAVHEELCLNGRCFLPSPSLEDSITGQSSRRLPPLPRAPRARPIVAGHERYYVPRCSISGAHKAASWSPKKMSDVRHSLTLLRWFPRNIYRRKLFRDRRAIRNQLDVFTETVGHQ